MSTVKSALIAAFVAEAIFDGFAAVFGHVGPCSFNNVAIFAMFFHLPGIAVSERLFNGHEALEVGVIFISGAAQFFLLAWPGIKLWRKMRKRRMAS